MSTCLSLKTAFWAYHMVKDVLAHVSIDCTKWVIEEVDVSVLIDRPGQRHALLLTARQVDALQRCGALRIISK